MFPPLLLLLLPLLLLGLQETDEDTGLTLEGVTWPSATLQPQLNKVDCTHRPMLQFNCTLQTAGVTWPTPTPETMRIMLLQQLKATLRKAGGKLAILADLIHCCHVVQPAKFNSELLRLNVTFKEAQGLLDYVPELLVKSPLFVNMPAASYAAVTAGSAAFVKSVIVKVAIALYESSWLAATLGELFTTVRVYPGATLTADVVKIVLQAYNSIAPGGRIFESVEAINVDMSQGVLVDGVPIGGNDYVAVLKHCRPGVFDQPVKLRVPLKAMFAGWDAAVVAAMPVVKEMNIVKYRYKSRSVRQQQQAGVVTHKKQKTDQGSVSTTRAATAAHEHH